MSHNVLDVSSSVPEDYFNGTSGYHSGTRLNAEVVQRTCPRLNRRPLCRAETVPTKQDVTSNRMEVTLRLRDMINRDLPDNAHKDHEGTSKDAVKEAANDLEFDLYLDLNHLYLDFNLDLLLDLLILFHLELNLKGVRTFSTAPVNIEFGVHKYILNRGVALNHNNLQREAYDNCHNVDRDATYTYNKGHHARRNECDGGNRSAHRAFDGVRHI